MPQIKIFHFSNTKIFRFTLIAIVAMMILPMYAKGKKNKKSVSNKSSSSVSVEKRLESEAAFIDAIQSKSLENTDEAIQKFKAILKDDPSNHAAAYELCRIFYELGDYGLAVTYGEKAVKLYSDNEWYYIYLAEAKAEKMDFLGAAKTYEQFVAKHPKSFDFYYDWAYMLLQANKTKEAIAVLDKLEAIQGTLPDIIMEKVNIYTELNKIDGAINEIQKLIKEYPEEASYYGMVGELYESIRNFDKAESAYKKILEIKPDDQQALLSLAGLYKFQNKNTEYDRILNSIFANPKTDIDAKIIAFIPLLEDLGTDSTLKEEALTIVTLINKTHPNDVKSLAAQGDYYFQINDSLQAKSWYEKAINSEGDIPSTVFLQLYILCADLNDYKSLQENSTIGILKSPKDVMGYFYNALANYQLKKFQAVIDALEKGLKMNIDNQQLKSQMYTTLADACYELKFFEKMDSAYEMALEIDPNNPYSLNNYAYYLSERSESLKKAELMSKRSLMLLPDNASFLDTYGWIKYKLGKYEDALVYFEKALRTEEGKTNDVIYEHLGDVYLKLDNIEKAVNSWHTAIELGGNADNLKKKIEEVNQK
jgi:tetratricopeptide (TPR) repeat protein